MKVWEYIRASRRNTALAVVATLVVVVGVLWIADVGPFAPSVEKRFASKVGAPARCRSYGLDELAGEGSRVYRCSYRTETGYVAACYSVAEGDVYDVTSRVEGC
jgi:hypothetical protein